MTVKINITNKFPTKITSNYAIFYDQTKLNIFDDNLTDKQKKYIKDVIKINTFKDNFLIINLNPEIRIIVINYKKKIANSEVENLGANFYSFINNNGVKKLLLNYQGLNDIQKEYYIGLFLHGLKLKSYDFSLYKSKKINNLIDITILSNDVISLKKINHKFTAIEAGTNFARDLVSEPPNILFPKEYVNRLIKLRKLGIKVTVYDEKKLKKLGMNSLLGVGRGSSKESFLVTLEWHGNKKVKRSPISFVGKGVCFDTGGISLKPAKFMEEMKYDMAGSAVVAGLIKSLAIRKVKVNAVGVVGLVENMPGGNAQRPGDVVKAYNGKTIEVLNTDAEGRLVLADALSFTEKKFKPKFIIDLATLTGAIIVSLGEEYAGLFSNNDDLSKKLFESGEKVNEKVWRLPLHKNYDKLMDSTIADIQNINYSGGAGSITAAQFLQRFIEKTPWAHLDIAGMAFSKKAANLNPGGATGFGVRLLNQLIEDYYE